MFGRFLPRRLDNNYRGRRAALWILWLIVVMKLLMAYNVTGLDPLISNRDVIARADGIPIADYAPEPASVVMYMFAAWGLNVFLLCALGLVVLLRYRAMVPFVLFLFAAEQAGRKLIGHFNPIIRSGGAAGPHLGVWINWAFTALLVVAFLLSLSGGGSREGRE